VQLKGWDDKRVYAFKLKRYTEPYMSIDNFRRPKPRRAERKAVDGIVGAPGGPRRTHESLPFEHRPKPSRPEIRRRLDDFNRAEGYHPIAQPAMHPQVARQDVSQLGDSKQPSLLNKTIPHHGQLADEEAGTVKRRGKRDWKRIRKWTLRTVLAGTALVVIVGGLLFAKAYFKLHQVFKGTTSAAALTANVNPDLLKGEGAGRINILLLGVGGTGHDGPDLTDTIMVASIDPVNNKAALLSIPRDLWVKMPNDYVGNYQKINAAYEAGKYEYLGKEDSSNANQAAITAGFKTVDETVSDVIGIPINYNVLVDFQAFQQAVDTVGGVTLNVPTELYDPTIAWENHNNPVIAKPGVQTMNGAQALLYARSRETSSDFARADRQRALLVALKDKTLSLNIISNPLKISGLLSAFGDNVRTDISISDAQALYSLSKKIPSSSISSLDLDAAPNQFVTTADISGISVVEPIAGQFNYTAIQSFVRNQLRDGYIAKENAQIEVLNGTAVPGLAATEATVLKSYGYNIGTVADAPTQTYQKTVIVDLTNGVDKYTKNYLQERFGVSAVSKLPDSTIQPGSAKFVIIIGQDEASKINSQ
jgi:polyisoprenyl-teichoic acid--peptidoglycan teichoic acid transferase